MVDPDQEVTGSIIVDLTAPKKEKREVARFDFKFVDEIVEQKASSEETSFNARVRGATFAPPN